MFPPLKYLTELDSEIFCCIMLGFLIYVSFIGPNSGADLVFYE